MDVIVNLYCFTVFIYRDKQASHLLSLCETSLERASSIFVVILLVFGLFGHVVLSRYVRLLYS